MKRTLCFSPEGPGTHRALFNVCGREYLIVDQISLDKVFAQNAAPQMYVFADTIHVFSHLFELLTITRIHHTSAIITYIMPVSIFLTLRYLKHV